MSQIRTFERHKIIFTLASLKMQWDQHQVLLFLNCSLQDLHRTWHKKQTIQLRVHTCVRESIEDYLIKKGQMWFYNQYF